MPDTGRQNDSRKRLMLSWFCLTLYVETCYNYIRKEEICC